MAASRAWFMGPLGLLKNETQQILAGTAAVSIVGALMGVGWLARISDRKPSTMTPAWKAATAKYRAAQNQDPISNMS